MPRKEPKCQDRKAEATRPVSFHGAGANLIQFTIIFDPWCSQAVITKSQTVISRTFCSTCAKFVSLHIFNNFQLYNAKSTVEFYCGDG